jgi:hypothetical protein
VTHPRWAQLATDLLAEERVVAPSPREEDRARAIAAIEAAIRVEARARRIRIAAGSFAVAAAIGLATFGAIRLRPRPLAWNGPASRASITATAHAMGGRVTLEHAGAAGVVEDAAEVAVGDRVTAGADGPAGISLSTGTHLLVEARGELAVVEQAAAQIYALQAGAVRADVAKVPAGGRFVVRTVDAEVEVRGTSFRVALAPSEPKCGGGTRTRVAVTEGVVVVRSLGVSGGETRVSAGESWPRDCAREVPSLPVASSSAPSLDRSGTRPPPASPSSSAGAPVPASELTAQNDLFAAAVAAKRRGDTSAAIAGYERYLAKYPGSPLAESATVERMRLLAASDPARGAAAAKSYLARYPGGFARSEADTLAHPF